MKNGALLLLFSIFVYLVGCHVKNTATHPMPQESPLAIVIKLEDAEAFRGYESAKIYIDMERVYGAIARKEGITPDSIWKAMSNFRYNMGRTIKFTSHFKYHEYTILEKIKGQNAIVQFISNNSKKRITYELEIINSNWKVVAIKYER